MDNDERNQERTHKQVLVIRKDLNLSAGKMVAQGAHASLKAVLDQGQRRMIDGRPCLVIPLDDPRLGPWLENKFTKIGTRVESEAELLAVHEAAKARGIITSLILDAALTELREPAYTAVAVGPDHKEVVDTVTGTLRRL